MRMYCTNVKEKQEMPVKDITSGPPYTGVPYWATISVARSHGCWLSARYRRGCGCEVRLGGEIKSDGGMEVESLHTRAGGRRECRRLALRPEGGRGVLMLRTDSRTMA